MGIMRNGKQARMGRRGPMKELSKQGLVEKPINSGSKGYGNLDRRSPKDLAKIHGNGGLEWVEDAQGNEAV